GEESPLLPRPPHTGWQWKAATIVMGVLLLIGLRSTGWPVISWSQRRGRPAPDQRGDGGRHADLDLAGVASSGRVRARIGAGDCQLHRQRVARPIRTRLLGRGSGLVACLLVAARTGCGVLRNRTTLA